VLARFKHDVGEAVYGRLLTIGHDEIARGGEALLTSDGELGRALFSASLGTTDLTAVHRIRLSKNAGTFHSHLREHRERPSSMMARVASCSRVCRS
jgi:AAA domain